MTMEKEVKTEKYGEEYGKTMDAIASESLSGLVKKVNSLDIKKDDIVTVQYTGGTYIMLYYR